MEQPIGNPITLLIERLLYLGLGIFFLAAIISATISGLNQKKD